MYINEMNRLIYESFDDAIKTNITYFQLKIALIMQSSIKLKKIQNLKLLKLWTFVFDVMKKENYIEMKQNCLL